MRAVAEAPAPRQNAAVLLNQTAEYALRAAAVLAAAPPGASLTASDLSAATSIPAQYVSKVMRRLVVAGLVRSRRGQGGGFELARDAAAITLLQVLEATDMRIELDRCAFGMPACDTQQPCPLHDVWKPLKESLRQWASGHTLADVAQAPKRRR